MDTGKKMFFGGTKFEPDDIAKSLRLCVKAGEGNSAACLECALHGRQFEVDCITEMGIQAAKMIESLAAENADLVGQLLEANAERLELREKVRWIPVGERLPEPSVPARYEYHPVRISYLTPFHGRISDALAFYDGKDWRWYATAGIVIENDNIVDYQITHWKPLSEGPKEG